MVVFGGGSPASSIPGRVQVASTGTLALNNGGDTFRIETGGGSEVLSFSYDGSIDDQSLTRDPDFTGPFVAHSSATGSGGALFSPGRSVEGDPLPVELVAFEGRAQGEESVVLTWQTASETQNAGFEVERQGPSERWQPIEFVAGAGTDPSGSRYRFTDSELPHEARELAYRLRQVDSDGTESFSKPIRVELPRAGRFAVDNVYPNPASGPITVELSVPEGTEGASLKLRDALGRTVRAVDLASSSQGASTKGTRRRIQISTKGLAAGMYFLTVSSGASSDRSAGPAHKVVLLQ
jgi:hypothetical protein